MTLRLFTARVDTRDPDRFVVVRAGAAKDPAGFPFAPSGDLLRRMLGRRAHDGGVLTGAAWDWYYDAFKAEMRDSYRDNRAAWDALLARERVVICCYCATDEDNPNETRCHRTILAEILVKIGRARGHRRRRRRGARGMTDQERRMARTIGAELEHAEREGRRARRCDAIARALMPRRSRKLRRTKARNR